MYSGRDLDAPEVIDSFGRSQSSFTGRHHRHERPAQAVNKNRGLPYERPKSAPAAGEVKKWTHDLFNPLSSLYKPSLNREAISIRRGQSSGSPQPSSSLRPFGEATPDVLSSDYVIPSSALEDGAARYQKLDPRASKNAPGGAARSATTSSVSVQGESARRRAQKAEIQKQREEKRKQQEQRKKLETQHAEQTRIAEQEDKGSVVQVEGLVQGTSADDVQTAFGAYGETSFCFVVDEHATGDLIARLTFKRYEDASQACAKLNGAIADGKPLKVTLVHRTPFPDPLPSLSDEPASLATSIEPQPARRMYADEVEALDPRYSGPVAIVAGEEAVSAMDVEDELGDVQMSGTRDQRGSKKNVADRRGPRVNGGAARSVSVPAPTTSYSLLSRFSDATKSNGAGPALPSASGNQPRSLKDRLNMNDSVTGGSASPFGAAGSTKPRGKPNNGRPNNAGRPGSIGGSETGTAPITGGGASLLSRFK
ncbi:hypothetical protein OIO90_000729 [Microbotryomycetes sp. JL221]|nr:hypothetical protein OIO90_000729 [Microbotryomycetes sp. JL221]